MKTIKKIFAFIFVIFMFGSLTSCFEFNQLPSHDNSGIKPNPKPDHNEENVNYIIPEVQRISMRSNKVNSDKIECVHVDNEGLSSYVKNDIENMIYISNDNQSTHKDNYLTPNQEFYLDIEIYNPGGFDIMMIEVNDEKYFRSQFDYVDYALVSLKLNASSYPGKKDYAVTKLEYLNSNRHDEIMEGKIARNAKVTSYVELNAYPSIYVNDLSIAENKIDANLYISDDYKSINFNESRIYLSDGNKIVYQDYLKDYSYHFAYDKLMDKTIYQYAVVLKIDMYDGKGYQDRLVYKSTFYNANNITIDNLNVRPDHVSFSVGSTPDVISVDSITVKFRNGGSFTTYQSHLDYSLNINEQYNIVVKYRFKNPFNANIIERNYCFEISTKIDDPVLDVVFDELKGNRVKGHIDIKDTEYIVDVKKVTLFDRYDDNLQMNYGKEFMFEKLYKNTKYKLRIDYSYSHPSSSNVITKNFMYEFVTDKNNTPDVKLRIDTNSNGYLGGYASLETYGCTSSIQNVQLYENDKLIKTDYSKFWFTDLTINKEYKLVVNYSYNFNDGMGEHPATYETIIKHELSMPRPNLEITKVGRNNIEGKVIGAKSSDMINSFEVCLYNNGILIESKVNEETFNFEKLKSGYIYLIKLNYEVNYTDVNGSKTVKCTLDSAGNYYENGELTLNKSNYDDAEFVGIKDGTIYAYYNDISKTWEEAKDFAKSKNGHLLTVNNIDELNYVNDLLRKYNVSKDLWLGGYYNSDFAAFDWITEEPYNVTSNMYAKDTYMQGNMNDVLCLEASTHLIWKTNKYNSYSYAYIVEQNKPIYNEEKIYTKTDDWVGVELVKNHVNEVVAEFTYVEDNPSSRPIETEFTITNDNNVVIKYKPESKMYEVSNMKPYTEYKYVFTYKYYIGAHQEIVKKEGSFVCHEPKAPYVNATGYIDASNDLQITIDLMDEDHAFYNASYTIYEKSDNYNSNTIDHGSLDSNKISVKNVNRNLKHSIQIIYDYRTKDNTYMQVIRNIDL